MADFDFGKVLAVLEQTPRTLNSMLEGLPDDLTHANEGPNTWSAFDVMGHMIHCEKADWVPRLKIMLGDGDKQFEPFDRFAQERDSIGKTLTELRREFTERRKENLAILRSLDLSLEDLQKEGVHPEFGAVNVRQLLSAWAAHDLGHIYQISRVMAKQFKADAGPWPKYLRVLND